MSALLLGHRGRCFDVRVSGDGLKALTASEDGCVKLWGLVQRTCIATLQHSSDAEALRCCFLPCSSSLVSCGSDGRALVWGQGGRLLAELSHGSDQIYACEPVPDSASLLTAADDAVFVWDLNSPAEPLSARRFEAAGGNGFGGVERNPDNRAYVFDLAVSPCDHSSFAAALSDGSVRVQDVRHGGTPSGPFLPSGALPPRLTTGLTYAELVGAAETDGPPCHATGVTWVGGDALLASLGSGDSVLIDLRMVPHIHTHTSRMPNLSTLEPSARAAARTLERVFRLAGGGRRPRSIVGQRRKRVSVGAARRARPGRRAAAPLEHRRLPRVQLRAGAGRDSPLRGRRQRKVLPRDARVLHTALPLIALSCVLTINTLGGYILILLTK